MTEHALTIIQPWADGFLSGDKHIETRSWKTNFRGPLYIHAGKGKLKGIKEPKVIGDHLKGCIICKAVLIDCIEMTEDFIKTVSDREKELGFYSVGRYAWIFKDIEKIEPIKANGHLGIWKFEKEG